MERLSLFLAYVAFGFFNSRNIGGFLHVSLPVLLQSVDLEFCSAEGGLSIIFNPRVLELSGPWERGLRTRLTRCLLSPARITGQDVSPLVSQGIDAKFSEEVDGQVTWKGVPNLVSPEFDRKTRDHNSEQMLGEGPRYVVDEIEGGDFDGTRPSELLPNQIERVQGQLAQGGRCDEVQGMREVKFSSCHVVEAQMRTKYLYHFK
ncbi:hypothetical protein Prudu_451S000100 [Prunus dulcis]|uniref:Uncharacterized protein n=1 Tax=Prunus dulcis TaxID=3755 RepID=A0A5H2XNN4_PRUDU|nr:hypothetical protein Prudu_451S000100 [Prunus dulcis]